MKRYSIRKVKDKAESYYRRKKQIFDLPFRVAIVGKSQLSGKTSLAVNLLAQKDFYYNDFKGENIFIVSPSIKTDNKLKRLISALKIPKENLMMSYDEELISGIYDIIEDDYNGRVEQNKKPQMYLFYFDDVGFSGKLRGKQNNMISKLLMNGRHLNISSLLLLQSYGQIAPDARKNLTGLVLFSLSAKGLESIIEEHNYLKSKKEFIRSFRKATNRKHSFFVINYSNDFEHRYLDSSFNPIAF
tara:strand:+ start:484 stop:1215 length:732 start_codon:yes stop_codon:yes gene_type:complete